MLKHFYVHFEETDDRVTICDALAQHDPDAVASEALENSLLVASELSRSQLVHVLRLADCSGRFIVLALRTDPSRPILEIFCPLAADDSSGS